MKLIFCSRKKILVSQICFDQMYIFFQIRAEVEADKDQEKKRAVNVATRSLERDLERLKADHATEIEQLNERHKETLTESKKKQWVRENELAFRSLLLKLLLLGVIKLIYIIFFKFFSVLIAKQRPFIGVVGIQHIVLLNANRTIGTENTNECAEEKGDPNLNSQPPPPLHQVHFGLLLIL